jgi:protein-tyrosine phosphatase
MSDALRRHVEFEACFNFRDLGGYETTDGHTVRWNTLYRADTLHRFTASDIETFNALGLRTVIDLRSGTEIDDYGRLEGAHAELTWHHVPMLDKVKLAPRDGDDSPPLPATTMAPGEGYVYIVETFAESVASVFALLAGDTLPAVFHCTAGKDRTGIVAAMLLDVLGVDDEVIASDYVLTERSRSRSTAWILENEPEFAAWLAQVPPEHRVVTHDMILGFLTGLRAKYGSPAQFLLAHGVSADQLDALRARLLVP